MDFKPGDIVKTKKEIIEKTKRQKSRGKDVDGYWLPFRVINAGRTGCKFEVINVVGNEIYLKWKNENNEDVYSWVYKGYFELKGNVEAEDW